MERVVIVVASAATLMGAGVVVVAQGVLDPQAVTWERLVGGSVLVLAAVFIARYSLVYIREIRTGAKEDREAWAKDRGLLSGQLIQMNVLLAAERDAWAAERADILHQLEKSRDLLTDMAAQLERERDLRVSLERSGLTDRRSHDEY
jgi:hypothetical protein